MFSNNFNTLHSKDRGSVADIAPDFTSAEEALASEFEKYWNKVAVGQAPAVKFVVDASVSKSGRDAFTVKGEGGELVFTGANTRSLFYALYDFFGREGCGWFWDGDVLPAKHSVGIDGISFSGEADKEFRGLRYFAHRSLHRFQAEQWDWNDWKREIDWMLKRKLDFFMLRTGICDLFQRAFPDIVKYPEAYECPEKRDRSYDDRTHFWKLEEQSALRKRVMEYARLRGIMSAEDFGTPTHWYSRTPLAFLEAVKPELLGQSNASYAQNTGYVWDPRIRRNLDNYFKLTQASVDYYSDGKPDFFHTIGVGERNFSKDRAKNHAFKLEVYDLIIKRLRESYPDTPCLIGTWDFSGSWRPDEIRELTKRLDPSNTLYLDYTSDTWDDDNNFTNWGIAGAFPWIYGIFHAYEASNEIRGNYHTNIHARFPSAAADTMCKGVVYWPECSHSDTLMIDYFSGLGWDCTGYDIDKYLPGFCRRRYGADAEKRLAIWRKILPLAEASRWGTQNCYKSNPQREIYPDCWFGFGGFFLGDCEKDMTTRREYFDFEVKLLSPLMKNAAEICEALSKEDFVSMDEFTRRDMIDVVRTLVARAIELQIARFGQAIDNWADGSGDAEIIRRESARIKKLGSFFADVLEASPEFSLNCSYDDIKKYRCNENFEHTLKGNANGYCRSHIYELARYLYIPQFEHFEKWLEGRFSTGIRAPLYDTAAEQDKAVKPALDAFFDKPLAEMAPDIPAALRRLPNVLSALACTFSAD